MYNAVTLIIMYYSLYQILYFDWCIIKNCINFVIEVILEMFPHVSADMVTHLRNEHGMNTVIDILISQQEKSKPLSLSALLMRHVSLHMDNSDEHVLKTNRAVLWNKAKVFIREPLHSRQC